MRKFNSNEFWENRYKNNRTSGSGSYGRLAEFKGSIINEFIDHYKITSMLDLGCGDGNQYRYFKLLNVNYIGADPSITIINKCKKKYPEKNKTFLLLDKNIKSKVGKVELTLSCDVLYHLINLDIWKEHIDSLFNISSKYVIIYASNFDKDWGNHCKSRNFTNYIKDNFSNWELTNIIKNKYPGGEVPDEKTSMSDFYFYKKK